MTVKMVRANTTFRGFLTLRSVGRIQWIEIKIGTPGILSIDGTRVTFEYGEADSAKAPIYFGDNICTNTKFVYNNHLEKI
jgi:hypothetical protein